MPYLIRPRAATLDELRDTPMREGWTVYEQQPVSTGLVSKDGHPIYRTPEAIGFVLLKEKD